jgi:hypothetical protein
MWRTVADSPYATSILGSVGMSNPADGAQLLSRGLVFVCISNFM